MKYAVEVIADSTGNWLGNGLTFDTEAEAHAYGQDLQGRWTLVQAFRVVEAPATA